MKESQHTEWKESWRDEHLRWICGFANAEGGVLVIGRNDKGRVVGIADAARLLEELPNKIRDALGIIVEVNLRSIGGKEYLEVMTPPYPAPISYRSHYYQRVGSTNQELKGAALDRFLLRHYGRHWDDAPMPGVVPGSLSKVAVDAFRARARESDRVAAADLKGSSASLMEKLLLVDGEYLKRAAVLAFHPVPERFVTGAIVKIGFFRTNDDLRYHDEVRGPLVLQVDQTVQMLRTKYMKASISYRGIQRVETYPVPEPALREAVLNAIIHKDYATGVPIQISVYDDKLMIWNPGQLPDTWTVEKLRQKHASHPFNPDLANIFFRAGDIEAWGRGIEIIVAACRAAGFPEPVIEHEATGLWVTFPYSVKYLREIEGDATDPVTTELTPHETPHETPHVTPHVAALIRLIGAVGEMARPDLLKRLGLKDRKHLRERYLAPAIQAGWIEMTAPDKPQSRDQRYRLTADGRAKLKILGDRNGVSG